MNHSTIRNQQLSPFLRLPGEIRNRIYAYHFDSLVIDVREPSLDTRLYSTRSYDGNGRYLSSYRANATGILRSCRQLNAEGRCLLFQYAIVRVEGPQAILHFLDGLSADYLSTIHTLYIASRIVSSDQRLAFDLKQYVQDKAALYREIRSVAGYPY
jgi:hypothetical protein